MKQADVKAGGIYQARVSGNLVHVRTVRYIERTSVRSRGAWECVNLSTGKKVRKTAAALRPLNTRAHLPAENDAAFDALKQSIIDVGDKSPIVLPLPPVGLGRARVKAYNALASEGKPWSGEFPNDSAADMDPAAVRILMRNLVAGSGKLREPTPPDGRMRRAVLQSLPAEPYGPGVDGPEVGQGIDAPWLDSKRLETLTGAFIVQTRAELVNGDRAALQTYLEARGFAVYDHESTDTLREAALEDYDGEKG